jgi:hypothetical protein
MPKNIPLGALLRKDKTRLFEKARKELLENSPKEVEFVKEEITRNVPLIIIAMHDDLVRENLIGITFKKYILSRSLSRPIFKMTVDELPELQPLLKYCKKNRLKIQICYEDLRCDNADKNWLEDWLFAVISW